MTGGPRGPKADKIWSDAVRLAALREALDENGQMTHRINIIANNLVRSAMDGDIQAIKEVGDRIDGKPKQAIAHSGDDENPVAVTIIERRIVKAGD